MTSLVRVALLLAALLLCSVDARKKAGKDKDAGAILSGNDKRQALDGSVRDGVVTFNSDSLAQLALRPDRPYHLFLLFTALDDKFGCSVCREVHPEFLTLGESYAASRSAHAGAEDVPVYFGIVDFDTNRESFGIYGMTSAPHIMYVAPDRNADAGDRLPARLELPERNMYNLYASGKKAENMVEFVKQKTGADFSIQRSKLFLYLLVIATLVTVVVAVRLVISNLGAVLERLRRKRLWMTVSLLFYGLSVSGMVYCIIREPPAYSVDRKGKVTLFSSAGRGQYVVEGLVVGAYDILAAVGVIALSQWAIYLQRPTLRYSAVIGCVGMFFFMYRQMIGAYIFKNRWYQGWMGL